MRILSLLLTPAILLCAVLDAVANQPPEVTNVRAVQRPDTTLVDITYDLADADGDTLYVTLAILDSARSDTIHEAVSFSGDLGAGLVAGNGKRIVWDVGKDLPNTFRNYVALVTAMDGLPPDEMIIVTPGGTRHTAIHIPSGEYRMGSEDGESDEQPVHTVHLNEFYIGKFEATKAHWNAYVAATTGPPKLGLSTLPVAYVTWSQANAYCAWAGGRLPTEAEWEKAACGPDGRIYPWGNELDLRRANFILGGDPFDNNVTPVGYYDGTARDGYQTLDGRSPYGLHDMAGNVWEWCSDWYDGNYYRTSPTEAPPGPETGISRVVRGGSCSGPPLDGRCSNRGFWIPNKVGLINGFRCVWDKQ